MLFLGTRIGLVGREHGGHVSIVQQRGHERHGHDVDIKTPFREFFGVDLV